jgi:hypothetical protein
MFSDQRARSLSPLRHRLLLGAALLWAPLLAGAPASAQQAGYGQTLGTSPMERQTYDGGTSRPNSGSILDSTNPIDLMNKIRRSTAMDDATPPASAIDQALKQLEVQSVPTSGVSGSQSRPVATTPVWSQPLPPAAAPASRSGSTPPRQPL